MFFYQQYLTLLKVLQKKGVGPVVVALSFRVNPELFAVERLL